MKILKLNIASESLKWKWYIQVTRVTLPVAIVIYQDTEPELGEVPDLEGYYPKEGLGDVKLGDSLSEDQQCMLKNLIRRHPDVFTDMHGKPM